MKRFAGKVVLVTGAGRGIGLAAARRLADEGAKLVLLDADGTLLAEVEAAFDRAVAIVADVAEAADWTGAVSTVRERFGRLDVLVNNAGVSGPAVAMVDYPADAFDRVMAVNARGVFLGMQATAGLMRDSGGGAIVNLASVAGINGGGKIIGYAASKHAVIGMTKAAAGELAPWKIRVNALAPAPIATEMMWGLENSRSPDDPMVVRRAFEALIPLGRYGEPDEIAAAIAFLASDEAAFITGATLPVDGGILVR